MNIEQAKRQPRRIGRRQAGQGMTEYIIIVALIAIAAITVVSFFGSTVRNQVSGMANELSGKSATQSIKGAQDAAKAASEDATDKEKINMGEYNNTVSGN